MSSIFSTQNLQTFLRRKNLRPRRLRAEARRPASRRPAESRTISPGRGPSLRGLSSVPIALVLSFRQPYFSLDSVASDSWSVAGKIACAVLDRRSLATSH